MARPKYHSGTQKIALGEVASATVIVSGDLVYNDAATKQIKPFASLGDSCTKTHNHSAARNASLGVARKSSQATQTNPLPLPSDCVFVFTATATEYLVGNF